MKKYILFTSIFTLILLFGMVAHVDAARGGRVVSIIRDSFNKYSEGSIIDQSDWFDRKDGSFYIVQGAVVKEGKKALYNSFDFSSSIITKTGKKERADGRQSFYVRTENRASWGSYNIGENFQLGLFQGSWDGPARATMAFMDDGHVAYLDTVPDKYVDFDTYEDNAWTHVEVEWRSSDSKVRWRVNGGTWTDWIPFVGSDMFEGFDTVGFVTFYMNDGGVYIDTLR